MSKSIIISSVNYDGEQATVLFKPDNSDATVNLGIVTLPYTFDPSILTPPREVFGTYTILVVGTDCPNLLNVPRPTPTPTPTNTVTPTVTPTPTLTITPTRTPNPCLITPTPTSTVTPTNTPTPTITPTVTSTMTPTPTVTPSKTPPVCLQQTMNWWNSNSYFLYTGLTNEYRYNFIPSTNHIQNGGYNMFNNGNYVFTSNRVPRNYGTLGSNFFITKPNVWPQLTLIRYGTVGQTQQIGTFGSTGGGVRSTVVDNGTYNCGVINGTWTSYSNTSSGFSSIIYVWFTVTSPAWGSDIITINNNINVSDPTIIDATVSMTGHSIYLGMTLLSKFGGSSDLFTNQEITNFLESSICNLFSNVPCANF